MYVRNGTPPHVAKRMLSAREATELFEYVAQNPIDDQSNFHYPIAQLEATLININRAQGTPPVSLHDRLLFQQRQERDIDEVLASDDW